MAKDEELELEEEFETEVETEEAEKIKIDFSLDPIERIQIELNATQDQNTKYIGEYLKEQFKTNEPLKNAYKDRKITLESIGKYVMDCAKKFLNSKNGMIEDKVVFGWVIHYVQDEKVEITSKDTYDVKLSKSEQEKLKEKARKDFEAQELAKLQKEKERKEAKVQKAIAKEKKHNEEIGQMSLFDL